MSMYKKIIWNDKEFVFKCSAGTEILFRRMFNNDLDTVFKSCTSGIDPTIDVQKLMSTVAELQNNPNEQDPERLAKGLEFINEHKDLINSTARLIEFAKEFAYITYLEANNEPREISKYLSSEEFLFWLMNFDEQFFRQNVKEFISFYQGNIHQSVSAKK